MAAAWQLMRLDPGRYRITVYQRGWRLGGKGASGRNRAPGQGLRIEEHGLHILMGFYDHVFHILRTCYEELGPAPADSAHGGIGSWGEALTGSDHLHICDRYRNGERSIWELQLPTHDQKLPGGAPPRDPDVTSWMIDGLSFIYHLVQQDGERAGDDNQALGWLQQLVRGLASREGGPARVRAQLLSHVTRASLRWALGQAFRRLGDPERRDPISVERRRQAMAAYFVGANLLGILNNGLWTKADFLRHAERVDHLDYREWLRQQAHPIGADWPELAWNSALVQSIYDLIFSQQTGFGAGTALYDSLLMLLSYPGHLYYRMNGGMGDVVFTPLYLWLRRHGVQFRFFQRVRQLHLEAGAPRIGSISVERQLNLDGDDYDPLFSAGGRACWPNAPLAERLPAREQKRLAREQPDLESGSEPTGPVYQLRRGRDFDVVVLGMPLGSFQHEPDLVDELRAAHPPFARMVSGIATAPTRAFQIWTDRDARSLGWQGQAAMLGAYEGPFGSWADMTQVLPRESWEQTPVRGVHYFCGVGEPEGAGAPDQVVRREAIDWLQSRLPGLLPGWSWDRACAPGGRGEQRFAAQYWRANSAPAERYVLAVPGSLRFRLPADRSGFDNLFLAGDWVRTDLNAGCLEAAAMAGVDAARAIHGRPGELVRTPSARPPAVHPPAQQLRPYVDRDGDWVRRAPVQAQQIASSMFLLRGDPEALSAVCAAEVDGPSGGRVSARPWPSGAGLVLLMGSRLGRVGSADPQDAGLGSFEEQDVGFFVPVALAGQNVRNGVALLAPYLFVDSPIGLCAGREIYGFSKLLARIEMAPGDPASITVRADVLVAGRVRQEVVLEVRPDRERTRRPALGRLLPPLARALARLQPRPSFGMPFVFLKQFRDASAPELACHQSLVHCAARVNLARTPQPLTGGFRVRLPQHHKPDLARTLGLPRELETSIAFRVEHDLYLPPGRQLWP